MKHRILIPVLTVCLLLLLSVPAAAAEGAAPVVDSGLVGISILIGVIIAAIVCGIMYSGMKNVRIRSAAEEYVTEAGLELTERRDVFLRRTVTRRKIESGSK